MEEAEERIYFKVEFEGEDNIEGSIEHSIKGIDTNFNLWLEIFQNITDNKNAALKIDGVTYNHRRRNIVNDLDEENGREAVLRVGPAPENWWIRKEIIIISELVE